ncbi:MAG: hypothetical protein ACFE68_07555 [Candidatus Hodarchaeota archaeon]
MCDEVLMGILKKIKEKITGKKEEAPKIEIKEEEKEEEEERKIMVKDVIIEPAPKVIEERKDTELPLIVLKEEEEVIVEKEGVSLPSTIEEKEEEGEIVPEEEGIVVEEERSIEEEFAGLTLGERFMKWFEEVFLGDEEVVEATRGLDDTVCSFICQDTQFYIEKKGVGNPARIVEGRSLKPDAHVRVSATTAENVIRIKNLEIAETTIFENPNNINIKFNVDVLDLTKKGYLRVPILRKIVR